MSYRPNEIKNVIFSGIFIFTLAIVIMISIFILGTENSLFESKSSLYVYVKNAQNLRTGTAVKFKGIKIGGINTIEIKDIEKIQIELKISSKYLQWIKNDSFVNIKSQGVLGDKFLEISGGSKESPPLVQNNIVKIIEDSKFDKIIDKSEDITSLLVRVLSKFDTIISNIDENSIQKTIINMEKTTQSTQNILSKLEPLDFAQAINGLNHSTQNMNSAINSISNIGKRIETGPGSMHSLIFDHDLYEDLKILFDGANRNKVLKYFIRESIKDQKN